MDGNYGIYLLLQGVSTSAAKEAKIFSTFLIKNKAFISDQEVCVLLFHFVSDTIFGQIRRYLWRYLAELFTRGGCTNEYLFLLGLSLKVKLMSLIFKYGIFQMGAVVKKKNLFSLISSDTQFYWWQLWLVVRHTNVVTKNSDLILVLLN